MKPTSPVFVNACGNVRRERVLFYTFRSAVAPTLHSLILSEEGDVVVSYVHNGEKKIDTYHDVEDMSLYVVADAGTLVRVSANLFTLYCSTNQLQELNVSGLTNLQSLYCSTNQLQELNVSGLTNLQCLYCDTNQLQELNVSGLTNLQELNCSTNQLQELNVSGLTNLQYLDCSTNQLQELNVSGLTNLQYLDCPRNQLQELNVSGLTNLQSLYCNTNQLQELNVSGLTNLQYLDCSTNHRVSIIRYNAITRSPSENLADLITDADATDGTVYLNADDRYYNVVADAATAKGWTIQPLV